MRTVLRRPDFRLLFGGLLASMAAESILLLAVRDRADVWIVYVVAALYGLSHLTLSATLSGLIRQLVPVELLAEANGALQTVRQGLRLVGPLAGAGLYAAVGGWMLARTPPRLLGRVAAAAEAVVSGPQALSIGTGALLVGVLDYRLLFVLTGLATLLAGGYLWQARGLTRPPAPHIPAQRGPGPIDAEGWPSCGTATLRVVRVRRRCWPGAA